MQDGDSIAYEYDGSGNVTKISYPETTGTTDLEYIYDTNNLLTNIRVKEPGWSSSKLVREYIYTSSSKLDYVNDYREFDTDGLTYIQTDYSYNNLGQINQIN